MRPSFAVLVVLAAMLAPPAFAQSSLDDYDKAREALLNVWTELPLTARNITLIKEAAPGYGNYEVHDGQSYKPGDEIHVYVEVLGYGWKDNGDGTLSELLDADLNLLDSGGKLLGTQPGFLNADIRSREKLFETYLNLSATLSSFDPGDYQLQFVLHDRAAGKTATFEVPVTLVSADASAPGSSAQ
jgi:hypothetical protein